LDTSSLIGELCATQDFVHVVMLLAVY